ncbi:hypothetical protein ACFR9U_04540 [Halorientalis brevis]|uniref:ATP-binding protein n=1 Tax=Halorientalis brevis TaxID=1126241 RepID=A0ABD6CA17_9EURY|nr:hypothetical protein [Halorientalis brevis]
MGREHARTRESDGTALLPASVDDVLPVDDEPQRPTDPEPIEDRPYLEVRPSERPLDPPTVRRAMEHLYTTLREASETGLLDGLTDGGDGPVVEWLLVSDGRPDPTIRYLVGTDTPDLMSALETVLRTCFPDTYELTPVEWHPRRCHEHLPLPTPGDTHPHPAITPTEPYAAGVEFRGHAEYRQDWQTPLRRVDADGGTIQDRAARDGQRRTSAGGKAPLARLVETICTAEVPVLYQVVCRPYDDWSVDADAYIEGLREGLVTVGDQFWEEVSPRDKEERREYEPSVTTQARIDGIRQRDPSRTFCVSARAVALTRDRPGHADDVARRLASAVGHLGTKTHDLRGHVRTDDEPHALNEQPPGHQLFDDLCAQRLHPPTYETWWTYLPVTRNVSRGIVVGADELVELCLVDGDGLTPHGERAIGTRPADRTGLTLPPPAQLAQYRAPGMALCMPLTHDRQPYGRPLFLRPDVQDHHLVVTGSTGAGKTALVQTGLLSNVTATDGLDVLFATKGGTTAGEYLRAHYATFGSLEDVHYVDLTEGVPALSFFDIQGLLDAGIKYPEARSRVAGQYVEIVAGLMPKDTYERGPEARKALRAHVEALFDSLHGEKAYSHEALEAALRQTLAERSPPITDDRLHRYFGNQLAKDRNQFKNVMSGALNRAEEITTNSRLAPAFEHVPGPDDPALDFGELLDEDAVLIFDYGGMEDRVKDPLTLLILSQLWAALKSRNERTPDDADLPLVNLYLEEAKAIVDTLLSEGRSFGLSLTLDLQFVSQLKSPDDNDTYTEILNETGTFVAGNVGNDPGLARVLSSADLDVDDVAERLRRQAPGEWLVRPGADYDDEVPQPFLAESLPLPAGHPAGSDPLTGADERAFQQALARVRERTHEQYVLAHETPAHLADDEDDDASTDDADGDPDVSDENVESATLDTRVDSLLPHTKRLPDCVSYDESAHALLCVACENRYDPTSDGMRRAIECCHALADVDPDDVPVCELTLKLSPEEITASEWSVTQLLFVQAVYNAQQGRFDRLEYDLVWDSMIRLREYVGIEQDAVRELLDAGVIREDGDKPHKLYSVAPDHRDVIGESYRRGVNYGHGVGDLEESAQHVHMVEVLDRYIRQTFRDDPDSPVVQVQPYYELAEGVSAAAFMGGDDAAEGGESGRRRLDVAGLDADGNVVVTGEAERLNHDSHEAIPADYDKMAACEPEAAIWVTLNRDAAHDVLAALNDPPDDEPRVTKEYSRNTAPREFKLDADGATDILTVRHLSGKLAKADWRA